MDLCQLKPFVNDMNFGFLQKYAINTSENNV